MKLADMIVGGHYNWCNQPDRLVYMGRWLRDNRWHQFAKVDSPTVVWCEVCDADLASFASNSAITSSASSAKTPPPPAAPSANTPIEKLLAEYTEECCDFTNIEGVKLAALRYAKTMPDSHARCLLYTLAAEHTPNRTCNRCLNSGKVQGFSTLTGVYEVPCPYCHAAKPESKPEPIPEPIAKPEPRFPLGIWPNSYAADNESQLG